MYTRKSECGIKQNHKMFLLLHSTYQVMSQERHCVISSAVHTYFKPMT